MINPNNYSKIMYNGTSLGKIIINGNVWWKKEQSYKLILNPNSLNYNLSTGTWDEDYEYTYSVTAGYWHIYAESSDIFSISFDDMNETFSVSVKSSTALYDGYEETIKIIADLDDDYNQDIVESYLTIRVYDATTENYELELRNIYEEVESDFNDSYKYKVTVYFDIYDSISDNYIDEGYNTFYFTNNETPSEQTVDLSWTLEINNNYYTATGTHTFDLY